MSKFTIQHDDNNLMRIDSCKSVYQYSFVIGSVMSGREFVWCKDNFYKFEHNANALSDLVSMTDEFLECVHDATDAISMLLTDDESEVIKECRRQLAWLLLGLGEMAQIASENKSAIEYTLRVKKNPANSNE